MAGIRKHTMKLSDLGLGAVLGLLGVGAIGSIVVLAGNRELWQSLVGMRSIWVDGLIWVSCIMFAGLALKAFIPKYAHLSLLALMLCFLSEGAGLFATLLMIGVAASAWVTGAFVLRWCYSSGKESTISASEALLVGAAICLAVAGTLLHFAVNSSTLYLGLCLLPVLGLRGLPAPSVVDLRQKASALDTWMRAIPYWAWVLGLGIAGWTLRWSSFPSLSYDDHALHLRLWTELLAERRAVFDVTTQIWSVAPFASDLLYSAVSLMAGSDARGGVNLVLELLLLALMVRILSRLQVAAWLQWLLVILMVSTPMMGYLLLSMQTELLMAVVVLAGLRLVLDAPDSWRGRHVLGVLACCALCLAIKLPGAVLGAMLFAALAVSRWVFRPTAPAAPVYLKWPALLVLAALIFVALHSYVYAWSVTGNPLFPLYNAVFKSPFAPSTNFSDERWIHGFSLKSYVEVFFKTSAYFESANYVAGWQYLLLLPLSLLAIWRAAVPKVLRLALLPLLGYGLIMFSATQYWRYMFPVMPIAGLVFYVLFTSKRRPVQIATVAVSCAIILMNLATYSKVSWLTSNSAAGKAMTPAGKQELLRAYAPVALLTEKVNQLAPGSRVLYPGSDPFGATLHGTPLYVNFYSSSRERRYGAIKDAAAMQAFVAEEKLDFAIVSMETAAPSAQSSLLREYMAHHGTALAQEGPYVLYRVEEDEVLYRTVFDSRVTEATVPREDAMPLPFPPAGITATPTSQVAPIRIQRAKQARYSVHFKCPSDSGFLIAQINWDKGAPYYRLVPCLANGVAFSEAVPIPVGVNEGLLYVTTRETTSAEVTGLMVEVN
jgi:hypothetical protein